MYMYMYSNWLQQNGELIFDISLETSYDNISLKASEYPDTKNYYLLQTYHLLFGCHFFYSKMRYIQPKINMRTCSFAIINYTYLKV